MKVYLAITAFLLVVSFAFWLEYVAWNECLEKNSFWYCVRLLGK